jgi:XTP/dITP diphosphohydrolase
MDRLLLGTKNPHKFREIVDILRQVVPLILPLPPDAPEVEEDEATFEENAACKALAYAAFTGAWVAADDSGLIVDALDGAPGVRSARYAGPACDPGENNRLLLAELAKRSGDRSARFVCAVALARPGEVVFEALGKTEGSILPAPAGEGGFGYDPIFLSSDLGKSFGLATALEKNAVSHRGRAFLALHEFLRNFPKTR